MNQWYMKQAEKKEKILAEMKTHLEGFKTVEPHTVLRWLEQTLNALVGEPVVAGVTFGDGEFVPIEDESLMQLIAEQLQPEEEKPKPSYCYWHRSREDFCWYTSCGRAFYVSGPSWHNCPYCKDFIVLDPKGEYVTAGGLSNG